MQRVTQSDEEVVEQARRVVNAKRKLRWVMLLYAVLFLGLCGYFTVAGIRKIERSDEANKLLGKIKDGWKLQP